LQWAAHFNVEINLDSPTDLFQELLTTLAARGPKPVVLIDEYEKPVTDLYTQPRKLQQHIDLLKSFYGTLKSKENLIHFCFITGVSKIGKISVMSDLNHLTDISTNPQFAKLAGLTQHEVEETYGEHLKIIAREKQMSLEQLLERVRFWYNGYSYDGIPENRLYNPFSLLNFLVAGQFDNFWFDTGTPTILLKLLAKERIPSYELENLSAGSEIKESADLKGLGLTAMMFQTGYLTIREVRYDADGAPMYKLDYPNREVRDSFQRFILASYAKIAPSSVRPNFSEKLRESLQTDDLELFFELLDDLLATIPYQITLKKEAYFHSILHVALQLTGLVAFSEVQSRKGRMDTVLFADQRTYIFEFKINSTPEAAIEQIKAGGYADRYRRSHLPCTLVGVNFDVAEKKISAWKQETLAA
jgi:Predicted AAA-ATPase/PD-(D/E)XK nuclease superfamily